ncbi:hypothetical protein HZS_4543, partial [Henneguya salminicola]
MSKKRGLSLEEKRKKLLELFYEKKEFFQLKELERIAPKEKGITSMSVKEVLQSLVDDNLVDSDKIGTSIYYWAFPSKAVMARKNQIDKLNSEVEDGIKKIKESVKILAQCKCGKEESEERSQLIESYESINLRHKEFETELSKYDECNPKILEEIKNHCSEIKDATNRWTDNIYTISDYCKNKLFIEKKDINSYFNIPE